jgi:uncharacterized membrane protein YbhN (UPF0104 family)
MSLAWLSAAPPLADLQSSLDSFFNAVEAFFSNLAAVQWGALILALLLYLSHQLCRSRAWFNVLRAAYPNERFRWRRIAGAQIAGVGINSILPARAGDVTKIYLAKQSIPASSYPAVTSSFFVDSVFDTPVGLLVIVYAIAAGGLPSLNLLPSLPAFDLAFWADHPRFLLFTITAVTIGLLVLFAVLSVRAVVFWRRIKQGVVILTDFRRYLREVASWMTVAWCLRFAAFWFSLEAFNVGGSVQNVLFMMAVQAVSTLTPFTPGGAGAQQALMVYAFRDVASRSTVLAYSVGQQIALAAFNVLCTLVAIFLMARTLSIRSLIRRGEEERRESEQPSPEQTTAEQAATERPLL